MNAFVEKKEENIDNFIESMKINKMQSTPLPELINIFT